MAAAITKPPIAVEYNCNSVVMPLALQIWKNPDVI